MSKHDWHTVYSTYVDDDGMEWEIKAEVRAGLRGVGASLDGPGLPDDPPEMDCIMASLDGNTWRMAEDCMPDDVVLLLEDTLWQEAETLMDLD